MLNVKTPDEVLEIIGGQFSALAKTEVTALENALGRILAGDVEAGEYVPGFSRSTVDGYALRAADTFGCSDSIPAILPLDGAVQMGEDTPPLPAGCARPIPTGGMLPEGADSVVMIEYTEDYADGTVGICKSVSPGENIIYKGDDTFPGKKVLKKGRTLTPADIGALAAMGIPAVEVLAPLQVGIISTGDELVPYGASPGPGQIRDVNTVMLCALCRQAGCLPRPYGIVKDREEDLRTALEKALAENDLVLLSGGSSVGEKDVTARLIAEKGELLLHGIAVKPGKPTILGKAGGKPVVGLPGHPAAAHYIFSVFVCEILAALRGQTKRARTLPATLSVNISANHGRAQFTPVKFFTENGERKAVPIHSKSGLITALAGTDGFIYIPRDCEGLAGGACVDVITGEEYTNGI